MSDEDLQVDVGGLKLRNPTILAAGIMGLTGASLRRVWEWGAGGVIAKTSGVKSKEGHTGPRVVGSSCGLINSMGLPNPGVKNIKKEIEIAKEAGATVLGSVFGGTKDEFTSMVSEMSVADAVELNLSCPHAGELSTIGQNPELADEIVKAAVRISDIPVWVKLPGNTNVSNLVSVAKAVESAGADVIVLINTVPAMSIDAKAERPVLGNKKGGLSGPAIKPIGLRLVYEVYEEVDIPLVGVGGISNGEDMIEYILAGASAVEIGTGVLHRDLEIFKEVCNDATNFLDGRKIEDLVGKAHSD